MSTPTPSGTNGDGKIDIGDWPPEVKMEWGSFGSKKESLPRLETAYD